MDRMNLEFDPNTNSFVNEEMLFSLFYIKTAIICSEEDIDKKDDEKNTILFWNTSDLYNFWSTATYLSAFPLWYNEQRKKSEKPFCMRIEAVGWSDNVNAKICEENLPCPDLIILGTTQFAKRFENNEIIDLNKIFNSWLAVPLIVDFRVFSFNVTTFEECYKKGFNLNFPPWTWEKAIEYAEMISECTGEPGFKLFKTKLEGYKLNNI
eukprot:jgi/Orpsp1_1/1179388/evm.model.c7180000069112.1